MSQQTTPSKPEKKSNSTNKLLVVLCILLGITCAVLGWQVMHQKTQIEYIELSKEDLEAEKSSLEAELTDMLAQYDAMETDNADMRAKIEEQRVQIEEMLNQVKENKGLKWEIYKLKKEAATLRDIMHGMNVTIDSLNTLNKGLIKENTEVKTALSSEKQKNNELSTQNEGLTQKVTTASRFVISGLNTSGIKVKNDNTGKETDRASKADKIRTCFTIMENKLSEKGNHILYVRILTPDGRVLSLGSDDSNMFNFNGVKGLYSVKYTLNYKGEQTNVCIDWKKKEGDEDFPSGEYNVEVYHDGADIGRTKFMLK